MVTTYSPGEVVPKTGTVKCTQHNHIADHVIVGTRFAPCMHWGEHDRRHCTWQYI